MTGGPCFGGGRSRCLLRYPWQHGTVFYMKTCEHCGEEFESTEYEDTYCSWDCHAATPLGEED